LNESPDLEGGRSSQESSEDHYPKGKLGGWFKASVAGSVLLHLLFGRGRRVWILA